MRRKAFTLTEIVIAILVLGIMAGAMTLSTGSAKQTAKQTSKLEADRIAAQLYRLIEYANRTHVSFKVLFDGTEQTESVSVEWQTPTTSQFYHTGYDREIKLSNGCSIKNLNNVSSKSQHNLAYDIGDNSFLPPSMTLQVKAPDESAYYIIIYVPGTRIRTSDTKP